MIVTVKVPKVGEATQRVLVVEWLVAVDDDVTNGQDVVVVETDKTELAIPTPVSGRVIELVAEPEQEIDIGQPLCRIDAAEPRAGDG